MKRSDYLIGAQVTSPYGVFRPFTGKTHTGEDWIGGTKFITTGEESEVVWHFNWHSENPEACKRIRDAEGSEFPMGWMYSNHYGMMVSVFPLSNEWCFTFCHLDLFDTAGLAQLMGAEIEVERNQISYNVWHEFWSNINNPLVVDGGVRIGAYGNTGDSVSYHTHVEARRMELGREDDKKWKVVDPKGAFG